MFLDDRKSRLIEIADTPKILNERVAHIVHENLDMRKFCARWMYAHYRSYGEIA